MNFISETQDDIRIITVNLKRATISYADEFKSILIKDINKGWKKIVVDLNSCEFMDSVFFGSLVSGLKDIVKIEGEIKICSSTSDARKMLEHTRANRVFSLYENREEAINSFKES